MDWNFNTLGPQELKEANRLHWAVKGHLIPKEYSEDDIKRTARSYFARLWTNCRDYQFEGFEKAWKEKMLKQDGVPSLKLEDQFICRIPNK